MTTDEAVIVANGGRCYIMTEDGKYVGFDRQGNIAFLDDPRRAFVYHYIKDNVAGQLDTVSRLYPNAKWKAVPAPRE